ncbi:hypothetical protein Ndes2437B_g07463 [Nannochloris sp. 'desiccata']
MALSNALHTKEITTAQVTSVSFGFFSEEEVKKISVKQIVSPIIFDNMKNPIKGGLYDPALGPMDTKEKCATCNLNSFECPGHFGHVELSVPLYNPLVFVTLYKLLRCTCLHCFKFRMAGAEVERYRRKLELLSQGRLREAQALVVGSSAAAKRSGGELIDDAMDLDDIEDNTAEARAARGLGPRSPQILTAQTLEAMIETMGDFFKRQPNGKCQNCSANNPGIKREGFSKLFAMPLPAKKRAANQVQGTEILSVLQRMVDSANGVAEVEAELAAGVKAKEAQRKKRQKQKKEEEEEEEEEEISDFEYEDDKMDVDGKNEKEVGGAADASVKKNEDSSSDDSDSESDASGADKDTSMKASGKQPSVSVLSGDTPKYLTPTEVREILRRMWELNEPILAYIYPTDVARRQRRRSPAAAAAAAAGNNAARRSQGYRDFFVQTVPVAPNRFRPVNRVGDMVYEHPQNTLLVKLINGNLDLVSASKGETNLTSPSAAAAVAAMANDPQAQLGRTLRLWLDLQNSVNALFDSSAADETHGVSGIRQQLEKKEGLFRKNMMGKRVNFAARSVISPDVYLNGGEIGVPPYFASRLSFPERVTPWNVERLREAVLAGPGRNPGAVAVEDERGRIVMLRKDKKSREAVAKTLYSNAAMASAAAAGTTPAGGGIGIGVGVGETTTPSPLGGPGSALLGTATTPGSNKGGPLAAADLATAAAAQFGGGKVVYRTMTDGDFMLTNRQPTLHKPGMMGHRARIMRAERTIRFHYANCSTFNADFDGDEINLHLPQDHLGRAEGYDIVHADRQFFVPTDGKPLRGLIQDHIVAGTLLTMKDRFMTRVEYCQLVYECVAMDCSGGWEVWLEPPAILKPRPMWTGKQVFTAVLMHYTRDQLPFTMAADSKVPLEMWGKTSGEGKMHIWRNRLVAGCVDKAAFGKYGLLHIFHELYGAERTSIFTAALSRLFTGFIQHHGFTCGMSDVLLISQAENTRKELLETADVRALEAAAQFTGVNGPQELVSKGSSLEDAFLSRESSVRTALSERFRSNSADTGPALDMKASGAMHPLSSEVVKACLPAGQLKPFRHNMMALMTITGAKGSVVNFSQISCLLGQQELEGRRVPRMASGKTLPCFAAYDSGARSGGFVGDRFLTGLRPQEYYFHCMAGREGLVDTTVKTSRSGYLQRCLVKNLEPLRVGYDSTVRDDCDGSVVQFLYGEDGADPTMVGCLRTLPLLFYNMPQFAVQVEAGAATSVPKLPGQEKEEEAARDAVKRRAKALLHGKVSKAEKTPPVNSLFFQSTMGVCPEGFQDALTDAIFGGCMLPPNPEGVDDAYKSTMLSSKKKKKSSKRSGFPSIKDGEDVKGSFQSLNGMDFQKLMHAKFYRSQAAPGEAVGVVAAQSVGEPSTQMTLNTFHMAGRGEANVTLGIPRLREILMTAAAKIKTPVTTLPLLENLKEDDARKLAVRLKRIYLAEALRGLRVAENVVARTAETQFGRGRTYTVRLQFFPPSFYPAELNITFDEISKCFTEEFVPKLQGAVKIELKKAAVGAKLSAVSSAKIGANEEGGAALTSEEAAPRRKKRSEKDDDDENREENEENEEGKLRFTGGRGEQATYGAGDEEDLEIEKEARRAAVARTGDNDDEDDDDIELEEGGGGPVSGSGSKKPAAGGASGGVEASEEIDEAAYACEVVVTVPLDAPKLLMRELVERVAAGTVMRGVSGITKCYVLDASKNSTGIQVVQTDGINIHGLWESADLIDVEKLTTNSPAAILSTLGVEAARATVVKEVSSVFGAYGIAVDPRHLSLIADHMTHMGGYRACNRIGIEASTSPFLKISFETAASFLVSATLHGDIDPLTSPAARIVLGRPVGVGTGSMELVQTLDSVPAPLAAA